MDPISLSTIISAIPLARTAFGWLGDILTLKDAEVISAHYNPLGIRLDGSECIAVEKYDQEEAVWWFSVVPVKDYSFVRLPLVNSCVDELAGKREGEANPDARYWRWAARPRTGIVVGGNYTPPNIKVEFIVVGYKPKALLEHFTSK